MKVGVQGVLATDREAWSDEIRRQVLYGLENCTDFDSLIERLPSVYPAEVLLSVDRLATQGRVSHALAQSLRRQAAQPREAADVPGSMLPLPHPLDYEWRFSQRTSHQLLDMLADLTPFAGRALLFGTPGIAFEAMCLPVKCHLHFVGEDNVVSRRLRVLNHGAGMPISIDMSLAAVSQVDAVVLDPPWYLSSIKPMLASAAAVCKVGGAILISLPPPATRASAERDQLDSLRLAHKLGLELIERWPLALRYETPFFERNALCALGIDPPMTWRRGDLFVFRKTRATPAALALPPPRRAWSEVSIGRMRVAIRHAPSLQEDSGHLDSLVEGDVLPSVSRSDPRRAEATVWTSGNRVFRTGNTQLVLEAALLARDQAFGTGFQPSLWCKLDERSTLEAVGAELTELAAIEAREERGQMLPTTERASCRSDMNKSSASSRTTASGPLISPAQMNRPAA